MYHGECTANETDPTDNVKHFQVAKVGDVLLDDLFEQVTLLGRNQDGSVSIRKANGDIIDRTTGHLRLKKNSSDEPPHDVGGTEDMAKLAEGVEPSENEEYHLPASDQAHEDKGEKDDGAADTEKADGGTKPSFAAADEAVESTVSTYAFAHSLKACLFTINMSA